MRSEPFTEPSAFSSLAVIVMCVGVSETYVLGIQNGCKQLELHQTPAAVLYPHVQVLYHDSRQPDAVTGWLLLSVLQLQMNHR